MTNVNNWEKYPHTMHLPWSESLSRDDKRISSLDNFVGREVIVTEKMDGENCTLYNNGLHARSLNYNSHPSRHWVSALQAVIKDSIPENIRISGENMYAKHSILYNTLPSYFLIFSIYEDNICSSWDSTVDWAEYFKYNMRFEDNNYYPYHLFTVPVLYRGIWDEEKVKSCYTGKSVFGGEQEGYVVRVASEFPVESHNSFIAKYVRANHVQPNEDHWFRKAIIPNHLEPLKLNLLKNPKYGF